MNSLEAARHLEQALTNLPEDYPYREEAFRAYGFLILGELALVPDNNYIICAPHRDCKWWLYVPKESLHED